MKKSRDYNKESGCTTLHTLFIGAHQGASRDIIQLLKPIGITNTCGHVLLSWYPIPGYVC